MGKTSMAMRRDKKTYIGLEPLGDDSGHISATSESSHSDGNTDAPPPSVPLKKRDYTKLQYVDHGLAPAPAVLGRRPTARYEDNAATGIRRRSTSAYEDTTGLSEFITPRAHTSNLDTATTLAFTSAPAGETDDFGFGEAPTDTNGGQGGGTNFSGSGWTGGAPGDDEGDE